ncbi:MAG: hypothetical protein JXQ29_12530 [Planctomycetes bacterium]|nr:hypothetical protein [Planctomycetota bacterium]
MLTRTLLPVLLLAACLAAVGTTGSAQGSFLPGDQAPVEWAAPGLVLDHASTCWIEVERLRAAQGADSPWNAFVAALGEGWLVSPDQAFGTPRWILGPGLETGIVPLDETVAVMHARSLAARIAGALGIDELGGLELMRVETTPNPHGHLICGVDFQQTHRGYDVRTLSERRRVIFRYDLTLGRLSNLGSDWLAGIDLRTDGARSREAAIAAAEGLVPAYMPGDGRVGVFETYVLVGVDDETRVQARLVHEVQIEVDSPAHVWRVILDAHSGERLFVGDLVCSVDVTGNVSVGGLDAGGGTPPAVPFSVKPARSLFVSISGGGSATTDANGDFTIPNAGTTQVTLTGRLAGDWCTVQNQSGTNLSFSQPAMPGTPANIVLNGTHTSEFTTAEGTAYYQVTHTHFFLQKRWPAYSGRKGLTTNVNIANTCNAYWTTSGGGSINFFRAGSGCNNTAFSDVMSHEFGHGFHYTWHGSTNPTSFSEGIGDHVGLYVTGQRVMGRGFRTNGAVVRDYRVGGAANNTQWPSAGLEVHKAGEIWAGCVMDLRDYLITKHGATQGVDIAETITIAQYSRNPGDMPDAVRETMVQDDNDANLLNGTPNFAEIAAAADRHNLPRPPDPVQFVHTRYPNTRDVVNDYVVTSKITSTGGPIVSAVLVYQIGTAPLTTVNLTKGAGDMYSAPIPAQPVLTSISYYLVATDASNNTSTEPKRGLLHTFRVAREIVALQDDFETSKGWTAMPDDNATTGRFERADPYYAYVSTTTSSVSQPEDDHTPGSGTMCYVTQNGTRGGNSQNHDVDGGKTSIVSPLFDLSGVPAGAATVDFAYWFVEYTAIDDALRMDLSSDGGIGWRAVWSTGVSSASWFEASGVVLPGPYTNTMKLRFWTYDLGTGSVTDALVDDVVVRSLDDNVAAFRAQTRTPAIGSTLSYTLNAPREPGAVYVAAFALTRGPVKIPGIGTMDLGLPVYELRLGMTDTAGKAAFPVPVPNVPLLKGIRVHTQAFLAGQAMIFSNLWTIDIQ